MFKSFLKTFSLEILPEIFNQYFLIFKNKNNMWQRNIFLKIWKIYSIFKNRKEKNRVFKNVENLKPFLKLRNKKMVFLKMWKI